MEIKGIELKRVFMDVVWHLFLALSSAIFRIFPLLLLLPCPVLAEASGIVITNCSKVVQPCIKFLSDAGAMMGVDGD